MELHIRVYRTSVSLNTKISHTITFRVPKKNLLSITFFSSIEEKKFRHFLLEDFVCVRALKSEYRFYRSVFRIKIAFTTIQWCSKNFARKLKEINLSNLVRRYTNYIASTSFRKHAPYVILELCSISKKR